MAQPISEVIAECKDTLNEVKAFMAKAETKPAEPNETEGEPKVEDAPEGNTETEETKEEKETEVTETEVTKEAFDELVNRVKDLEDALKAKEEETKKLKETLETSTEALNRVNAYFKKPENRAQFAEGVEPKATVEATEEAETSLYKKWMSLPRGSKASMDFYEKHKDEIIAELNK